MNTSVDHARLLRRVHALIARATHRNTAPPEAAAARAKADELVAKYGLAGHLDPVRSTLQPWRPAPPPVPAAVHLMSGFAPSGEKWRACCCCGYRTTPRVTRDRALAALAAGHQLDIPECVICGQVYDSADWMAVRDRHLRVLVDPDTSDVVTVCRDMLACLARSR